MPAIKIVEGLRDFLHDLMHMTEMSIGRVHQVRGGKASRNSWEHL